MVGTVVLAPVGMVLFEDIFLYWSVHLAKGVTSAATLRSVDGIWMEMVVAAGVVEFIGYRCNCAGVERSVRECADLRICRFADLRMI